jgi:hypothetical protein
MNTQIVPISRRTRSHRPDAREQAALRRVAAQMQAEAAELPPTTWAAERLQLEIDEWGERVLPELALLMAIDRRQEWAQSWMRRRPEGCPLTMEEEACLRRVAALLRAEAAELGSESPVGARLDSWGIQLALDCEHPSGPRVL